MSRKEGEHDFKMPKHKHFAGQATFSVGVFAWRKVGSEGRLVPGRAKVRVVGPPDEAGYRAVHDKALEVANALDAGTYTGPKKVYVKIDNM